MMPRIKGALTCNRKALIYFLLFLAAGAFFLMVFFGPSTATASAIFGGAFLASFLALPYESQYERQRQ